MSLEGRDDVRAPSIILVTDPRYPLAHLVDVIERVGAALERGRLVVQLRDKVSEPHALVEAARALREATIRAGGHRLVVNARSSAIVQTAHDLGADGVHVPSSLVEGARATLGATSWVSTPAHDDDDVTFAAEARASAVLVSPIWATPHKGPARGTAALQAARAIADASRASSNRRTWIYALGGVDESRAAECADAGADGIAVIRALLDPKVLACGNIARLLAAPFRESHRCGER